MTNKIKKKTEKGGHRFHVIMNESMQQPMVNLQGLKSITIRYYHAARADRFGHGENRQFYKF
jgi:thiamine biosynthesis lipoprotein ApbE